MGFTQEIQPPDEDISWNEIGFIKNENKFLPVIGEHHIFNNLTSSPHGISAIQYMQYHISTLNYLPELP